MSLDMEALPGEGAAPIHTRPRRATPRPVTERRDLKICGRIPDHLNGVYLYVARQPAADDLDILQSLRLSAARVVWSQHHWSGMTQLGSPLTLSGGYESRRYAFAATPADDWDDPEATSTRLVRTDLRDGSRIERDFGESSLVSGFVAVPKRDGAAEEDSWLMGIVYDGGHGTSALHILDAVTLQTVAKVAMPSAMPDGADGSWIGDT